MAYPTYQWSGIAWFAMTPFLLVLRGKTWSIALVVGVGFVMLLGIGITPWSYETVAAYFSFSWPMALLVTGLILAIFCGSYMGLTAVLCARLLREHQTVWCWLGIPAVWVSSEFVRSDLFFGFAWTQLSHTQYRYLSLIQIADITGVYGLSFLLALCNYVVAEILITLRVRMGRRDILVLPWPAFGALVLGYTFTLYYGTLRLRQYPPYATAALQSESVNVALVTAHSPSAQRWQRVHYGGNLLNYIDATQQGITSRQSDLIVWPEFAVGFYLDREPALQAQIGRLTRRANAPLLLGAPRTSNSEAGPNYYNTAYFISANGRLQLQDVYDKIRLLPFAEFRPFSLPALVSHRHERPSLFTPGERPTIFSLPKGDFGVMICYEATYPYLARRLVQRGAQFLVNISNDVWLSYGGPAAAQQHFAISVFRAVETKRSLARVATAGLSGFVDPAGRRASLSVATSGVTFGEIAPGRELTLYTRYGDGFAWACTGFALMAVTRTRARSVNARSCS